MSIYVIRQHNNMFFKSSFLGNPFTTDLLVYAEHFHTESSGLYVLNKLHELGYRGVQLFHVSFEYTEIVEGINYVIRKSMNPQTCIGQDVFLVEITEDMPPVWTTDVMEAIVFSTIPNGKDHPNVDHIFDLLSKHNTRYNTMNV